MKSEPDVFSIDQLKKDTVTPWEGVRNYQARNFMAKDMKIGDEILFYHSSCDPAGVAGLATVASEAFADPSQFDKKSEYYDPKASKEKPIWFCVNIKFKKKFKDIITLSEIKSDKKLSEMLVVKKGQRLSIQPVDPKHFEIITGKSS